MFLSGSLLDRRRDVWVLIELGGVVAPWSMLLYMPLGILHQIAEALPFVSPGTCVMHIAERSLNRVGPGTGGREPEPLKTGVTGQLLGDGFRCMPTIILDDDIEAGHA